MSVSALSKRLFVISQNAHLKYDFEENSGASLEMEIISLIEEGADPNYKFKGTNPLCEACRNGIVHIAKLLVQCGAMVNISDKYNCTPLYLAASHGHLQLCQFLVEHGAAMSLENKFRYSPLLSALENKHIRTAEFLIKQGANVNSRHPIGIGPLEPQTLFEYVLFRTEQEAYLKLTKLLLIAGVKSQSFNVKSTFFILNMQQVPQDLIKVMINYGFKFHPQSLDWNKNTEETSEDEMVYMNDLREELTNVPSLQRIVRTALRNHLSYCQSDVHIEKKIDSLEIPHILKLFLRLDELSNFLSAD